jgi:hypothetical protein
MELRVFEVNPGQWAYTVSGVYQEWNPILPGFVVMTKEEAEFFGSETLTRLNAAQ